MRPPSAAQRRREARRGHPPTGWRRRRPARGSHAPRRTRRPRSAVPGRWRRGPNRPSAARRVPSGPTIAPVRLELEDPGGPGGVGLLARRHRRGAPSGATRAATMVTVMPVCVPRHRRRRAPGAGGSGASRCGSRACRTPGSRRRRVRVADDERAKRAVRAEVHLEPAVRHLGAPLVGAAAGHGAVDGLLRGPRWWRTACCSSPFGSAPGWPAALCYHLSSCHYILQARKTIYSITFTFKRYSYLVDFGNSTIY